MGTGAKLHIRVEFSMSALSILDCYHIWPSWDSPAQEVPSCRLDKLNINRPTQSRYYALFLHWNSLEQMEELAIVISPWLICIIQTEHLCLKKK